MRWNCKDSIKRKKATKENGGKTLKASSSIQEDSDNEDSDDEEDDSQEIKD